MAQVIKGLTIKRTLLAVEGPFVQRDDDGERLRCPLRSCPWKWDLPWDYTSDEFARGVQAWESHASHEHLAPTVTSNVSVEMGAGRGPDD